MQPPLIRNVLAFTAALSCTLLNTPAWAASFNLPSSFNFAGQSYNQTYLNDNGTLSFGNEYLSSGPGLDFQDAVGTGGISGIIAVGFGDYSVGSGWTPTAVTGGEKFSFSGVDNVSNLTNTFSVTLFANSTAQFNWSSVVPDSIAFGLAATGISTGTYYEVDGTGFGIDPANPFFFHDCAVPGGGCDLNVASSPVFNTAVPEPGSAAALLAFGGAGILLRRHRPSTASRQ